MRNCIPQTVTFFFFLTIVNFAAPVRAEVINQFNDWALGETKDEFNDRRVIAAVTESVDTKSKYGNSQKLVARCKDGELDLIVDWGEFITTKVNEYEYIDARIDKNEARKYTYKVYNKPTLTYFDGAVRVIKHNPLMTTSPYYQLIDEMTAGNSIILKIYPWRDSARVARFSLKGFKEAYEPVLQCYKDTRKK